MGADFFEHYVELILERVQRPELRRRLGDTGWVVGEKGGPSWITSDEHVRPDEPRYYARRMSLFSFPALARFHFAVGDPHLRRISIVCDPMPRDEGGAAPQLVAALLSFVGAASALVEPEDPDYPECVISAGIHAHDDGVQVVIDIKAIPPPEASLEPWAVYND